MNKHTTGSVLFGESPAIRWLMLIAMIVNASFLVSGTAFAETIWTPSVSLAAMHDDNILFTSTDTVDDYIYSAQPQI